MDHVIIKYVYSFQLIYRFNIISKSGKFVSACVCMGIENLTLKFTWICRGPRIAKASFTTILKKKIKVIELNCQCALLQIYSN